MIHQAGFCFANLLAVVHVEAKPLDADGAVLRQFPRRIRDGQLERDRRFRLSQNGIQGCIVL
jgi:hypothetical protein